MDVLLLILAVLVLGVGLLGCVLPVLPGPPISWVALILVQFTHFADFSKDTLVYTAIAAVVVTILDFIVPLWGTRRFGGSKKGIWGATIGMVTGIFFFPPVGLIVGPFLGALAGEMLDGKESHSSFRAAIGSFLGFLLGIGLKLITSLFITAIFIREIVA